jgi:hypothetical protein
MACICFASDTKLYTYKYIYTNIYIQIYVYIQIYIYTNIYIHIHVHSLVCLYTNLCTFRLYIPKHLKPLIRTFLTRVVRLRRHLRLCLVKFDIRGRCVIYIYFVYKEIYSHEHISIYTYAYINMCMYIFLYINTDVILIFI